VEAGLRVELIGSVLKQVRKQGGLSHFWKDQSVTRKDVYLAIIRSPKDKITQTAFIHSWAHLQNVFERDFRASVLVIPVERRFALVAGNLFEEKKEG
jgi:hypothetical protein